MPATAKRTSTGSRSPWSGLLDVLLGRTPTRTAGFFQGPKDAPDDATPAPDRAGTALDSTTPTGSDSSGADPTQADQTGSDQTGGDQTGDGKTGGDQAGDAGDGLQVRDDRITLDAELGVGAVDGVWWPRSDRAADEVGTLVEALPDVLGRVLRIALSMDDWSDDQPRVVQANGHPVHLAWFDVMRRHTTDVTFEDGRRVVLLVLPPSTEESAAREVLEAVGEDRSRTDLLSRAGIELQQGPVDTSAQDEQPADSGSEGAV